MHPLTILAILFTTSMHAGSAEAFPYEFKKIADTRGNFEIIQNANLNQAGMVAFDASLRAEKQWSVYGMRDGGTLTRLAGPGDRYQALTFSNALWNAINDNGDVAFSVGRVDYGVKGVYSIKNGVMSQHFNMPSESLGYLPVTTSITNSGLVGYVRREDVQNDIFHVMQGTTEVARLDARQQLVGNSMNSPISNEQGQYAVHVFTGQSHIGEIIYFWAGGNPTMIAHTGSITPWDFLSQPSINESGDVVFAGKLKQTDLVVRDELLKYHNGQLETVFHTDTSDYARIYDGVINDLGEIAFSALDDAGVRGIFRGPDRLRDRVLAPGDHIGSELVSSVQIGVSGFNNRGQVLALVTLQDGSEALVLGTPVPEPSTVVMLLFGSAACFALKRRSFVRRQIGSAPAASI